MKPGTKYILVEKENPEKRTPGGILIAMPKDSYTGRVIDVGAQVKYVKIGDRIKYHQNCGTQVIHNGKECILLSEAKKEGIAIL